jgi:hypothetical protein
LSARRDLKRALERELDLLAHIEQVKREAKVELDKMRAQMFEEREHHREWRLRATEAEAQVTLERNQRASAQRGLKWYIEELTTFVTYLRNHGHDNLVAQLKYRGLVAEVGYDLETDVVIQADIAAGLIPPLTQPSVSKEIAAMVVNQQKEKTS